MPTPYGKITTSEDLSRVPEPAPHVDLIKAEQCPCFSGATCPTNGEHLPE